MKSKTKLLLVIAAVMAVSAAAAQSVWEREVQTQIDEASYQFRQAGFHKLGQTWIDELEEDDDTYITVELDSDYEYIAIGVCDGDCGDIDLILYDDDDVRIANDVGTDDIPVLSGSPDYNGEYYLEAVMVDCDADTCAFGVALYAR
jgi:hypothetical protein